MSSTRYARLLCSAAVIALASGTAAYADDANFNIQPQSLNTALNAFSEQSAHPVLFKSDMAVEKLSPGVSGPADPEIALAQLLQGTGLSYRRAGDTFVIVQGGSADPQSGSAAGDGAGTVEALIVTAQKREEDIQDVPIAISAFTQEDLTTRQVAGGPDLITQIPNFSFTKTNFSSYSIQIRGIGTQAISATTDPAVAVAFNNTPFVRNRFFEQEFYDLERLEVLRGPQGTLYGRNATAGVVNIISAKPKFRYEAKVSADLSNYSSTRLEGMINFPLVEDVVALRLAGAWTKRDGYAYNQMSGQSIDGRDLWSTRLSLRLEPTDRISVDFVWEHFEEDDDRLRSGKQLCKRHTVTEIGGLPVANLGGGFSDQGKLSQGCLPVSLYSEEAFQTPNGASLPYYSPLGSLGLPVFENRDPYRSTTQSRDLRVIESSVEPDYRAKTDIAELQVSVELSDSLTLSSETAYSADSLFSLQDYNRFTTANQAFTPYDDLGVTPNGVVRLDGFYCDPQLGCSDRLLLVDLSTAESTQFSQELRLGSDFDGPFNFSLGANYLRHDAEDKYYVFINSMSLWGEWSNMRSIETFGRDCFGRPGKQGDTARRSDPDAIYGVSCPYVDPNPIGALNDRGRNYFLSKNPYKLISYAAFGEVYYNITPDLKLTGGLRFTVDRKIAPQIPSWLLASTVSGDSVTDDYPTSRTIVQEWREPTGRLAIDWKPALSFTDETLVYASYARGYKAGGANPPPPIWATYVDGGAPEPLPDTFEPEFVDAFELGSKNTLFGGSMTLNLNGFYYDYKSYQTSEIRNRSAVNSNFDAEVWGAEFEADWRATDGLRLGFKGGWQQTRLADSSKAVDLMDRTAGNPDWVVLRPFPSVPSNCIVPVYVVTAGGSLNTGGQGSGPCVFAYADDLDPVTRLPYDPSITNYATAPKWNGGMLGAAYASYTGFDPTTAPNGGRGFDKPLGGNELPNAPQYTATVTADYAMPLPNDWLVNFHADYHWQSESWARVFNSDPYDRIQAFSTVNISAIFTNEDAGWKVMTYVKNVFDETAITGAFLNSDDTGLTTNVFLTEPRLYGVRVTKDFTGGMLGDLLDGGRREPGTPYPLQVEIGAQMSRFDNSAETYAPAWMTPALVSPLGIQDDDLDWGDLRSVRLTFAPASGWRASAAYLYGRTNGQGRAAAYAAGPSGIIVDTGQTITAEDYVVSATRGSEEHEVLDFAVGKEIGLGVLGLRRSMVSAGVRYASFKSWSRVAMDGVTDDYVSPTSSFKYGEFHNNAYTTSLDSRREFEGVGPSVSWSAAIPLAGSDEAGHLDAEWSIGAGVLFGKQTADSSEDRWGSYYFQSGGVLTPQVVTPLYDQVVPRHRTQDVTVPNLSLSLGLSYEIDRIKVSTGYSYDRFFDAIDGGYQEAKDYDRAIHGPYLKLSLGFGG